jgi:hypothetical protein
MRLLWKEDPWEWQTLRLLPVSLLLYFLPAQSVFVSENYHYKHFCEKNGYMTGGECWKCAEGRVVTAGGWEMEGRLKHGTFSWPLCGKGYHYQLSCEQDCWISRVAVYVPFQRGVGGFDPRDSFSAACVKGSTSVNRLAVWHKYASGGSMTAEERCGRRVSPWVLFYAVSCVITCFFSCSLRQPYSVGATIQHLFLQNKKDRTK